MKRLPFLLLAVLLTVAVAGCEPPGPSNCTDLVEYPKMSGGNMLAPEDDGPVTGPYKDIVIEGDPDVTTLTIIRPRNIDKQMPVLAWGEGGCVKMGRSYAEMMGEVASYGIIVIADGGPKVADMTGGCGGGQGNNTSQGVDLALVDGIDYAFEKNKDKCSPLYQKVDTSKVAVAGQSCGGLMTLYAAGDPRVTVTFVMSSGLFADAGREEFLPQVHTPIIYLNGGPTDVGYANAQKDIEFLKGLAAEGQFEYPILWGNRGIGHMADILTDNGGTFGAYMKDWLIYKFFDDPEAKAMFEGDNCGYCEDNDPSSEKWTLEKFNGAP